MIGLRYPDTIRLVDVKQNGYGDESLLEDSMIPANMFYSTTFGHAANVDRITSDAHVYVDPEDEFVIKHANRLEGMLVYANMFNGPESEGWYRVASVRVGMDKLLTNKIDNIHLYLNKTAGLKEE